MSSEPHPETDQGSGADASEEVISNSSDSEPGAERSSPLLVKLTGYRILNLSLITAFGAAKAILTFKGYTASPATLDWILSVVLTILLYWTGLYEAVQPPVLTWFFHTDYSHETLHFLRLVLEFVVMGVLLNVVFMLWISVAVALAVYAAGGGTKLKLLPVAASTTVVCTYFGWNKIKNKLVPWTPSKVRGTWRLVTSNSGMDRSVGDLAVTVGLFLAIYICYQCLLSGYYTTGIEWVDS